MAEAKYVYDVEILDRDGKVTEQLSSVGAPTIVGTPTLTFINYFDSFGALKLISVAELGMKVRLSSPKLIADPNKVAII